MARSSSFSKNLNRVWHSLAGALVAFLIASPNAYGINLHALYTASCHRQIGVILGVSPRKVFLLNLNGDIVQIERFEIISYATYPVDVVPIRRVNNPEVTPLVRIQTLGADGDLVELIRGWPIDFSKDKIAFLTLRGSERLIDRRSIWKIEFEREQKRISLEGADSSAFDFVHPYAFSTCPAENTQKKTIKVFPQQLMSDPVTIKRELDRLIIGHEQIKDYESDQQFYPVPEVYGNETTLGMWLSTSSRYGASETRANNFTPFLTNEYSSGPFGFQSEFKSGAGPIFMSIHEEPQTQIFYRMKADYFHFSGMVDPNLLLVGTKYKWTAKDLDNIDIRANDSALLEAGFDYGRWAIEFHLGGSTEVGVRYGSLFKKQNFGFGKIGVRYQARFWTLNIFGGSADAEYMNADILRVNLHIRPNPVRRFEFSFINRDMEFSGPSGEAPYDPFTVSSTSQTLAAYGHWRFKTRYWVGLMGAVEQISTKGSAAGVSKSDNKTVPKAGGILSLTF